MARIINLPEIEEPKKQDRGAKGCAVVIVAWLLCMLILAVVALTGGLARLAFWAVGV